MRRAFRREEYAVQIRHRTPAQPERPPSASWRCASSFISPSASSPLERYQDLEAYPEDPRLSGTRPRDYRFSDKPVAICSSA